MKSITPIAALMFFVFLAAAEADPAIRAVAPNVLKPGESLRVRIVLEDVAQAPAANEISFGAGIRIESVLSARKQIRYGRSLIFMELNVNVSSSAQTGPRRVSISGLDSTFAGNVSVSNKSGLRFGRFRQISSALTPWRLVPQNIDGDARDELTTVNISQFTLGHFEIVQPFEKRVQIILPKRSGVDVSAREAQFVDGQGDGVPELFLLNWQQHDVAGGSLLRARNTGDGSFVIDQEREATIYDQFMAVGDFNGDRLDDIALLSFGGQLLMLPGGGKPAQRTRILPADFFGEIRNMLAGDINKDGIDDIILGLDVSFGGNRKVVLLRGKPDGFQPPRELELNAISDVPWVMALADVNHDGAFEVLYSAEGNRKLAASTFRDGKLQHHDLIPVECEQLTAADMNSDQYTDAICVGTSVGQISIVSGSNKGLQRSYVAVPTQQNPVSVAAGDWNGDGKMDLVTGHGGLLYLPDIPPPTGVIFQTQN